MKLRTFLFSTLTALAVISCGGGGGNMAGGIGGTGVSAGPATAFGSVIVNGVEYNTDSAVFKVEGASVGVGSVGQQQLAIGMMVSVTHDNNGNAKSVSFQDDAEGPLANIVVSNAVTGAGSFTVLGLTVTVNDLTVFSNNTTGLIGASALAAGDMVEVSGQLTGANTVLATRIEKMTTTCGTAGMHVEVKGTVSNVDATNLGSFDIDSIGDTLHVNANGHLPAGLADQDYVEVTSTACPSGGILVASAIDSTVSEGPDLSELDQPGEGDLKIKGIVSDRTVTAQGCTFSINGQAASASTALCNNIANGDLIEAHGQLSNGLFTVSEISNEDSMVQVGNELTGAVTVTARTSSFEGIITVGGVSGIVVNLNTLFEGETQSTNLATFDTSPQRCAEVKITNDSPPVAISIQEEDCH